ncbi:MAG: asparaginase [Faecalibacterium sp.]
MPKQKILFITTGGTIASIKTEQGLAPLLSSDALIAHLPELAELCAATTLPLCSVDSTDITPAHWLAIAHAIEENYHQYDGFVVCHGTDTLAYTAAALSYLIRHCPKSIIITGSQQPISHDVTDAKKNLRDSVICALSPDTHGVMVVFGGQVMAGTRAKKHKTISYDAFSSINCPSLAQVQGDKLVRYIPTPVSAGAVHFYHTLSPRVFLLKLTPGMTAELIPAIFAQYDCVIVESFGVGGIPQSLMDAFAAALGQYQDTHKILVMTTQVLYEGSDVGIYEVGRRARNRFAFLEAHDMTIEAVYTKCMWLLAQNCETFAALQQAFYHPVNFDTFYQPE